MLSTPGIGSGLDIGNIISQLMSIERRPLVELGADQVGLQAQGALAQVQQEATDQGWGDDFRTAAHAVRDLNADADAPTEHVADLPIA